MRKKMLMLVLAIAMIQTIKAQFVKPWVMRSSDTLAMALQPRLIEKAPDTAFWQDWMESTVSIYRELALWYGIPYPVDTSYQTTMSEQEIALRIKSKEVYKFPNDEVLWNIGKTKPKNLRFAYENKRLEVLKNSFDFAYSKKDLETMSKYMVLMNHYFYNEILLSTKAQKEYQKVFLSMRNQFSEVLKADWDLANWKIEGFISILILLEKTADSPNANTFVFESFSRLSAIIESKDQNDYNALLTSARKGEISIELVDMLKDFFSFDIEKETKKINSLQSYEVKSYMQDVGNIVSSILDMKKKEKNKLKKYVEIFWGSLVSSIDPDYLVARMVLDKWFSKEYQYLFVEDKNGSYFEDCAEYFLSTLLLQNLQNKVVYEIPRGFSQLMKLREDSNMTFVRTSINENMKMYLYKKYKLHL